MKKILITFLILLLANVCAYAKDVRVRVFSKYGITKAVIDCATCEDKNYYKCKLELKNKKIAAEYPGGKIEQGSRLELFAGMPGEFVVEAAGQSRSIPGRIEALLLPGEQGIVLIATMDIEDYVTGVLYSELSPELYSPELAKAFAVVIRTFASYNNKRHDGYDFCDLTHCEVFKGVAEMQAQGPRPKAQAGVKNDKWRGPVEETKGMVLKGACAKKEAYFSACCGGVTEDAGEFAEGKPGKCGKSMRDELDGKPLCAGNRYFKWVKHIYTRDVNETLAGFIADKNPDVTDIKISSRTVSGRVKAMDFTYTSGGRERHATVDAVKYISAFGKKAGWNLIISKFFEIKKEGSGFVLYGRGFGHGTGLCLQGASELAKEGKNYKEILKFYFMDLSVSLY